MILVSTSYSIKAEHEPAYLKYRSDFVQQVYSKILIGFAFERKCNFLEKSMQVDFEKRLNFATEIFQGYLLAKKMVMSPTKALSYPRDMAFGAKRFSGMSNCESTAKDRVNIGFDTAKNFMSLIDSELRKEVPQ
jgi:hypothetical protein